MALRHLIRAYNTDNAEVADKIVAEAATMLTVVSKVEQLLDQ